jgi:predicted PurR-regulated permease PerM
VLRRWLVTQLIAMLVIGTVTTIAMALLRVKAAFALGVIAGLLEFIPTIGPVLSAVPAIAMGLVDSPEKALSVLLAYWGIQFLENHLLIPFLMRGGMDLPPALTLVAQALMTLVFGFLGLMVAVPLTAAALVPIKMLYVQDVVGDELAVRDEDDD